MKRSVLPVIGLTAFLLLAGCLETMPGPDRPRPPRPPRPERPAMCTKEYAPVCGAKRHRQQTFGNACMARAEGFRVISQGECRGGGR